MEKELVFISWSGSRSRTVAQALYDWLPKVIQTVDPWMSEHSIDKGARWRLQLANRLKQARFGLSCLTPENLDAPWLLFEAGAISKAVEESFVWTYLLELGKVDVTGPLADFNHTEAEEKDTRKLVQTINKAVNGPLSPSDLDETFTKWWPDLEQRLRDIPPPDEEPKPKRSQDDVLEEILVTVRDLSRRSPYEGQWIEEILMTVRDLSRRSPYERTLRPDDAREIIRTLLESDVPPSSLEREFAVTMAKLLATDFPSIMQMIRRVKHDLGDF